jgi:hypothetical protein
MKKILLRSLSLIMAVVMTVGCISFTGKTTTTQAKESKAYTIKVNLGTNCVTIYKGGKAVKAMISSPSSETPIGTFYVPVKYRWHEMIGNCYAQYCTRISYEYQILFHSVWYYHNGDKSSMSVAAYNVMGQKASHGCVRLLCKDAKWIYDHCAVGTKIVIFNGTSKDDPLGRPSFTPITNGKFTDWDPTDPDPKNPYRKKVPTVETEVKTIEFASKVNVRNLITVRDSAGNNITSNTSKVKIKGSINTKKLGTYKITVKVKDSFGKKLKKVLTFKVVDTKKPKITGAKKKSDVALGKKINLLYKIGAKAATGADLTSRIKVSVKYKKKTIAVKKGIVTFKKAGTYKVTYTVKGKNKLTDTKTIKYKVKSHKVKLTLKSSNITINQGSTFKYNSYVKSVKSYKGKNLNVKKTVTYEGNVDTSTPGKYVIIYKAQYKNQEYTAVTKKVTVIVKKVKTVDNETTLPPTGSDTTEPETTAPETTQPEEVETTASSEQGANSNEDSGWTGNY